MKPLYKDIEKSIYGTFYTKIASTEDHRLLDLPGFYDIRSSLLVGYVSSLRSSIIKISLIQVGSIVNRNNITRAGRVGVQQ